MSWIGQEWIEFIGKNTPSSKNSRQWNGKFLMKNKLSQEYEKWSEVVFENNKHIWLQQLESVKNRPLFVAFYFFRDSKRRFDANNVTAILTDLMTKHGYIEDDNADQLIPLFAGYEVVKDKSNSGFMMRLLSDTEAKNYIDLICNESK